MYPFNGARTFLSAATPGRRTDLDSQLRMHKQDAADRNVRAPLKLGLRALLLGRMLTVVLFVISATGSLVAQETVTIPKSRLEELQRKEAELDSLKGDLKATKGENLQLKKQHQEDAVKISATPHTQPVVTHVSPPMAS